MTNTANKIDFQAEFKRRALELIYGEHMLESYQEAEYSALFDAITSTGKSEYQGKAVAVPDDFENAADDTAPMLLGEAYATIKDAVNSVLSQHYIVNGQISDQDAWTHVVAADDEDEAVADWKDTVEHLLDDGDETYVNSVSCLDVHLKLDL